MSPRSDSTIATVQKQPGYFNRASLADLALAIGNARVFMAVERTDSAELILREVERELLRRCDRSGVSIFDQDSEGASA